MATEHDDNAQVIDEFRANHGWVGGRFDGIRLLLLTTTGAESQYSRTTPVGYFPDGKRKLIVAASTEVPGYPPWYHDLLAQPQVTVEDGPFIMQAKAAVLDGDERDRVFARLAEADPALAEQQARMTRAIPVVALDTISGAPTETMLGKALKATHDTYRRELARIRTEVATSGAGVGAQLRINCLTMCQGIHQHHTGEDTRIFPSVHKEHPELAPLLERLSRDHQKVQRILDSLQEVVSTNQPNSAQVLTEVERLIAELEAHLDYEEAHLLPTLDTVPL